MSEISRIDVQIFPDYTGGIFAGNQYIDPQTLEERYFNTFADEGLVAAWKERVVAVRDDTRRMLVHLHQGLNNSGREYLQEYARFLREQLHGPRLVEVQRAEVDVLRTLVRERALVFSPDVQVEAYGHHRGDCVPKEGRKIVDALGLPADRFTEIEELSVGDMVLDRVELIRSVNPGLYRYFSDEHLNELRLAQDFKKAGLILGQRKYLFLYCTPEAILDAARRADSIESFGNLIGGDFSTFNFFEDYLRLRRVKEDKRA